MFYAHAHMRYVKNRKYPSRYVDDLYPLCSEQHYSECACIVWLYHAYSYTVGPKKAMNGVLLCEGIRTTFFLLSVSAPLKKKKFQNALFPCVEQILHFITTNYYYYYYYYYVVHATEGVINKDVVQALLPDDFKFDMQQDLNIHAKNSIPSMRFVYVYVFVLCFVMYVIPEK